MRLSTLLMIGVTLTGAVAMTPGADARDVLSDLRWQHRVLLVFSPGADDARASALHERLDARACEVAERDLVVGRLPADGEARLGEQTLTADSAARLRAEYGIGAGDFAVILIGKDGGEKLRAGALPDLDAVFARIDGMPMRRAEMRARANHCAD